MELNKKDVKIFILSGKAEVGKDTVANMMIDTINSLDKKAIKISYASYLKEYAKNITGWDGKDKNKPRTFLQELGVDLIKNKIDDKFLINRILQDIEVYSYFYDVIIISDARFVEEIEVIKKKYSDVSVINVIGKENSLTEEEKNHITETALNDYQKYDYKIENINLEQTKEEIKRLVRRILMNKIIAVVGMCGSGKSIASEYYEERGYKKVYFGGVTMEKLQEEGLEVTPENERMMRERLRKEYGMAAYATLSLPKIEEYIKESNVVLDGLYSWDELIVLKEKYPELAVLAIVVDKDIRYNRLSTREVRPFTNEEAQKRDITEIENLAKGGPIAYADYYILNSGSITKYYDELERITEIIEGV